MITVDDGCNKEPLSTVIICTTSPSVNVLSENASPVTV